MKLEMEVYVVSKKVNIMYFERDLFFNSVVSMKKCFI